MRYNGMKFQVIIPLISKEIIAFLTQFAGNLRASRARTFGKDNRTRIHNIFHLLTQVYPDGVQPVLRQCLKCWCQPVQPLGKRLVTGHLWKPFCQMIFRVFVDHLLFEPPLTDAPQVNCYSLIIAELGTIVVILTLHFCFDYPTITADSAIELDEICLSHTYILRSFALFSTSF